MVSSFLPTLAVILVAFIEIAYIADGVSLRRLGDASGSKVMLPRDNDNGNGGGGVDGDGSGSGGSDSNNENGNNYGNYGDTIGEFIDGVAKEAQSRGYVGGECVTSRLDCHDDERGESDGACNTNPAACPNGDYLNYCHCGTFHELMACVCGVKTPQVIPYTMCHNDTIVYDGGLLTCNYTTGCAPGSECPSGKYLDSCYCGRGIYDDLQYISSDLTPIDDENDGDDESDGNDNDNNDDDNSDGGEGGDDGGDDGYNEPGAGSGSESDAMNCLCKSGYGNVTFHHDVGLANCTGTLENEGGDVQCVTKS